MEHKAANKSGPFFNVSRVFIFCLIEQKGKKMSNDIPYMHGVVLHIRLCGTARQSLPTKKNPKITMSGTQIVFFFFF